MRRATITSVIALFFAGISLAQTSDSYQGFRIGMGLSEMIAVGGGNLDKARALCANPPKHLSDKQQAYLASICPKIERTLAGQPTEWEFPKEQLRLAFDKGHIIRVTDFNGVVHLEARTAPTMPTPQTQAAVVQDQDVAAASRAMRQAKPAQASPSPVSPQAAKPARQPSIAVVKVEPINDAFAKAALRALKAIQGDATIPEVTQGGEILFSKQVVDAIDAADSEARTGAETSLSKTLSVLHVQHSTNNMKLVAAEEMAKAGHQYQYHGDLAREMETRDMLQKDPHIAELKKSPAFLNVDTCAVGLETLFRSRKSGPIPTECAQESDR